MKLYEFSVTRSIRCLWALRELGLTEREVERVEVDLSTGAQLEPAFLAVNPLAAVPVLNDGFVLTQSTAICTYLSDRRPGAALAPPPGTQARALYDQWLAFAIAELDAPLWTIRRHLVLNPLEERVPAIVPSAVQAFRRAASVLESHLRERPHVLGEHFTVADIVLGHTLMWAAWFPAESATGVMEGFDRLHAYIARLVTRAACPPELAALRR